MADWQFLTEFHFIRPLWLLGILPAVLCLGVINKISRQSGNWEKIINPDLLPYLMQNGSDNNNYANNSNTENGVLVIGVQNDATNSVAKDAVAIESSGDIWLNPGTTNDSYGGASGPNFTNGKVYIGRETTKYQVWHEGNDGSGSTLDADKLDGQEGSYYQNAGNLNAGTIPDARLANSSLFVTGMILMYTGNSAPSGWAICNGQNGTQI